MENTQKIKRIGLSRIELIENEDVYDITVRKNHNFFANGILVHNCAEIGLRSNQFCNLTTTNTSIVNSQAELNDIVTAAAFIGTLQAGYTDFHYLRDIWKQNSEEEALIGVSMTGIGSGSIMKLNLKEAAECVNKENERVAKLIGINPAARTTCIKPEGSASCVVGSSSGIHAWHNDYYIRRMRIGKNEPLFGYLNTVMPELIEDCVFKPHLDSVISIPQKAPVGSILRTESVEDLLARIKRFNEEWVQPGHRSGKQMHNVSSTVSIKPDEWELVCNWMWNNQNSYTGISVLPYSDHTYQQAPFEDCSKETFEKMFDMLCNIDLSLVEEKEDTTNLSENLACSGNNCEISF